MGVHFNVMGVHFQGMGVHLHPHTYRKLHRCVQMTYFLFIKLQAVDGRRVVAAACSGAHAL